MTYDEKLQDIRNHPELHRHSYEALVACCFHGGALDSRLMEAHEKHSNLGTNGGVRCDVTSGPCACGAWH